MKYHDFIEVRREVDVFWYIPRFRLMSAVPAAQFQSPSRFFIKFPKEIWEREEDFMGEGREDS